MFRVLTFWRTRRTLNSLSSSEDDRAAALLRLARLGDRRAVGLIVAWLIESPTITPRDFRTAATVLPKLSTRDALSRIEPFLKDPVRRQRACEVLGYMGEPAERILKPLVAEGDPWAMAAYEVALGRKAVPFFLHLARLSKFGGARCVLQHGSADDIDALLLLLLQKERLENLRPLFSADFRPTTDAQRAIRSVFCLPADRGQKRPGRAVPLTDDAIEFLAAAFTNSDAAMRESAARAIIAAQSAAAPETLVPLLQHKDRRTRQLAAMVLQKLQWQPASREEMLRHCIAASRFDAFVREGAASVPQLLKVMEHSPAAIADALGRIGDTRAVPALIGLLSSHDADVQTAAARALGTMRVAEATTPLLGAVHRLPCHMELGMPPADAERTCAAILEAVQQCLPESPSADLQQEVLHARTIRDRLSGEAQPAAESFE